MKTLVILITALAIALVFLCYKLAVTGKGEVKKQDTTEVVINNILQRTSVRSYADRPVEKEKVEKLLRAGMAAPSAVNKQPWHFIVVTDKNQLQKLSGMGLGSVWTGTYPAKERCAAVAKVLSLPETLIPLNTIIIGYPDAPVSPKDKWNTENISYNVYGQKHQ